MSHRHVRAFASVMALAAFAGAPVSVFGQEATKPAESATPMYRTTGDARRDTLVRLTRNVSVDFQDKRLEDVLTFIQTSSGADIEPLWIDDQHTDGLDKEKVVSVKVDGATYLALIEKVLDKARGDAGENTWQMSETGSLQIGPKNRLNLIKRVQLYDINDLLMELPIYSDVPRIDLQQALQSSQGGGGGGQSPFREQGNDRGSKMREKKERADEVLQLITQLVEPDQWVDNGGSGGTIRYYNGTLIVNAPDYMHRGIDGYPYWPAGSTSASTINGRRYVSLTSDAGLSRIAGFGQSEVSAVVGGKIIRSGGPPGGGGSKGPSTTQPGGGPK